MFELEQYFIAPDFFIAPKSVTNKLQRVLNAAARVVSGTRKCDRGLSTLIHIPHRATLAWCSRSSDIQARLVDAPVSAYAGGVIAHCLLVKRPANIALCDWSALRRKQLRLYYL